MTDPLQPPDSMTEKIKIRHIVTTEGTNDKQLKSLLDFTNLPPPENTLSDKEQAIQLQQIVLGSSKLEEVMQAREKLQLQRITPRDIFFCFDEGTDSKRVRSEPEGLNCSPVPGCILKIELQNFMCHTFFEVELSPTVNFIVGRNGSGKSAILMALVIGLGGKSSATNRAPNMTEFIKQGSTWCQVTITICNSNVHQDAWEFDKYGNTVIVERKITKIASFYKLKNSEGKVISSLKKDLTLLLDNYNIQVNNPVSILDQEMSKRFLTSTDPSDKYEVFMKSTHLKQTILHCQQVKKKLGAIQHTIKKKKQSLPDLKNQAWLKDKLIWRLVKDIEEEMNPIIQNLSKITDSLPVVQEKIAKEQERYNEAKAIVKAIEKETTQEMEKYVLLESEQASLKRVAQAKKRLLWSCQEEKKKLGRTIKEMESDRARCLACIKEIEEANKERDLESEKENCRAQLQLQELKIKYDECTARMTTSTANMEELERKLSNLNEEVSTLRGDIDQHEDEIRKHSDRMKTQQEAKKNRVRVFGSFMPDLLKRVQDAHGQGRFHQKPRGPFGLHIKVRDPKWATVVEMAIGSSMCNFVVNDSHDRSILQELFSSCCQSKREWPNMFMMRFREDYYDVSSQKPQSNYPTLYDMLDINDNMISNALVESFKIEQCLLIESSEAARKLIVGHAPRNVFQAWTLSGVVVWEKGSYSYDVRKVNTFYFQNDPSGLIEELKRKIHGLQEQVTLQRQNRTSAEREVGIIRRQYTTEQSTQQTLKKQLNSIRYSIIELDNVEDRPLLDTAFMEPKVQDYTQQLNVLQEKFEAQAQKQQQYQAEYDEASRVYAESIERDSSIANKLEELKMKLHEGQRNSTKRHDILEMVIKKKKTLMDEKKKLNLEKKNKESEIRQAQTMAAQQCERVNSRQSARDLEQYIQNMEQRIQQYTRSNVCMKEISRRYHEAKTKYEDMKDSVSTMERLGKLLEEMLTGQHEHYFNFQKEICIRLKYFFVMNLSQHGYTGKLDVDHEKRHLSMQLNIDTSGASTDTHDVQTLSWGEQSFAAVCFICSLWNIMDSPFRCLDGFDVFMDLYNRRITMNLLMEHASQTPRQRQYILFTPQDMSTFSKKFKNIKILQLAAPERQEIYAS